MVYVKACARECPQWLLCQEESMGMQNLAVSAVSNGPYFNSIVNSGTKSYAGNLVYPATIRKEREFSASLLTIMNIIIHRQQLRSKW